MRQIGWVCSGGRCQSSQCRENARAIRPTTCSTGCLLGELLSTNVSGVINKNGR